MNFHSELGRLTVYISIAPPEESEQVSMVSTYIHLMEHSFDVTGESNGFFTKATEDSVKAVGQIRTLQKMSVKGLSVEFCTGIEDDTEFCLVSVGGKFRYGVYTKRDHRRGEAPRPEPSEPVPCQSSPS